MRLGLAQLNTTVGDLAGNRARILDAYRTLVSRGAELVLFPELAVCGYPPRDLLFKRRFVPDAAESLAAIAREVGEVPALIGTVEANLAGRGRPFFNAAAFCHRGAVTATARKRLLPTYDVFDEDRYFEPGGDSQPVRIGKTRVGVTICEDIWNDEDVWPVRRYRRDPVRELTKQGIDLLINLSASPWNLGKEKTRYRLLREVALRAKIPVAQVNAVGGNDELVFDGQSLAVGKKGGVLAQGAAFGEQSWVVDLDGREKKPEWMSQEEQVYRALVLGTKDYLQKCGFREVVLGLSGGIDSALTAVIAAEALGPDKVLGVAMPSRFSSEGSVKDAEALAKRLKIRYLKIPIENSFQSMLASIAPARGGKTGGLTEENLQSRLRGVILMAISNDTGRLLLTTGNKSELAVGYCTLYGDMCGALAPIGDLYKTEVWALSRWANANHAAIGFAQPPIPEASITKVPSAELRPDQTDQDTLPPYEALDAIVRGWVEEERTVPGIAAASGLDAAAVARWTQAIDRAEFKRRQAPVVLRLSARAFGPGRRMPVVMRDAR